MMKRTIQHMIAAVMTLITFTACESELLQVSFGELNGQSIKLLLSAQGDEVTRAISRSDGENAYGENTIETADVFFYKEDGTLLYHVAKGDVTLSAPSNGVVTATVPMPADKDINIKQAKKVYVMGNRQATDEQVAGAKDSESALRALAFTTEQLGDVPTTETTFAMDGTGDIQKINGDITGNVELVRAAAKITLDINIPTELESEGITYQPKASDITLTLHNGVNTFNTEQPTYFDVTNREILSADGNEVKFAPFYSYPTTWEARGENEPYFTLNIPWGKKEANGSVEEPYTMYHYRVPINKDHFDKDENGNNLTTLSLKRNHWYQIELTVGVLGTPDPNDEVEVEGNYQVKPWGNLSIGTDLLDYKYLVVDQNLVNIYNQNSAAVAYASSHPVTLEILSISKWDYSQDDSKELIYKPAETNKSVVAAGIAPTTGVRKLLKAFNVNATETDGKHQGDIVMNHELVNRDASKDNDEDDSGNKEDDYDYVYYTIEVKVSNGYYEETITFIQYPEIYIQAHKNEGGNTVTDNWTNSDDKGFVFVYGNQLANHNANSNKDEDKEEDKRKRRHHFWNAVRSCQDGGNKNPNMYIITVTALDRDDIKIGDPRAVNPIEGKDMNFEGSGVDGLKDLTLGKVDSSDEKTLTYYYPTRTDDEAQTIIAPQFRMASSYGKCGRPITPVEAKNRCAAYQEVGYPAGRWRVPTKAELQYVEQLSSKGIIPKLYSDGSNYYTAAGWYKYGEGNQNTTEGKGYVRCVYDDWYWGSEPTADKTRFTWGDEPRN